MTGQTRDDPFSVSALTAELKSMIEGRFTKIYVEAEISGLKVYPSGHLYFTLKDDGAQVQAVMFRSAVERCRTRSMLKDGAKVLVYANATVYAPRGNYQLVVLAAKPTGEGDLMQRYLELKKRLGDEGLFDDSRKRPLPSMPRRIGIVTSESGAVIHDMCTVLTRRFPDLWIRLYPAQVQGEAAAKTIIAGIAYFNSCADWKADILIVARGGGSFEDLFCFNDESLVRAVAGSGIPVISAVGHETDFTLCDFAADIRAGTPSIAAEIAVPVKTDIMGRIDRLMDRLSSSLRGKGEWFAQRIDHLGDSLVSALRRKSEWFTQRIERLDDSLLSALKLYFTRMESRFQSADTRLKLLSPYSVLERGYSLTTTESGAVIRSADEVSNEEMLITRLAKGVVRSRVLKGDAVI